MFPSVLNGTDNPSRLNTVWDKFLCAAVDSAVFATLKCTSAIRYHHRLKTFHGGPDGWQEVQLPDGTIVLTSPTGRVYRNTPAGTELFPQLRPACAAPTPRKRSRRREKAARTALARNKINAQRPSNAETRRRQTTVLTMRWSRSQ